MIGSKMLRILTMLKDSGHDLSGVWIDADYKGNMRITPNSQLDIVVHERMLACGLKYNHARGTYHYPL
jgi:hypothetical protein